MSLLCFIGITDNCGNKTYTENVFTAQNNIIKEFVSSKVSNTLLEQKQTIENVQSIIIESGSDSYISDLDMTQTVKVDSNTTFNIENSIKNEESSNQLIDLLADVNLKQATAQEGITQGQKVFTKNQQNTINSIKEQFKSLMKQSTTANCINNVINSQSLTVKSGGSSYIRGLKFSQTVDSVSSCYISSIISTLSKIKITQDVNTDTKTNIDTQVDTKGLFAMSPIIMGIIIVAVIIGVVIIVIILIFVFIFKKKTPTNVPSTYENK